MKKADDKTQKQKLKIFRTFIFLFPKFFKHIPWMLALYLVLSIAHGISLAVTVPLKQNFFDTALAFSEGNALWGSVLISLAVMGGGHLINQALNGIANYLPNVMGGIVGGRLKKEMHVKMSRLRGEFYEDTKKLDSINRADMGRENAFWMIFNLINIFTFYVPYFAFMGWYLFRLKPVLILALVLAFVPTTLSQIARARIFFNVEDKAAPIRRELDYYQFCILDRCCYKETRLLGGFNYFKRLFMRTLKLIQQINYKAVVKSGLFELGASLGTVAGYFVILWMLFDAVLAGEISVGAFAAVFSCSRIANADSSALDLKGIAPPCERIKRPCFSIVFKSRLIVAPLTNSSPASSSTVTDFRLLIISSISSCLSRVSIILSFFFPNKS